MNTIHPGRRPASRPTVLLETRQFTEEPTSLPQSPTQTIHFLNRVRYPKSRQATERPASNTPPPFFVNGDDAQRKWTQEDQDQYDEKTRKAAMNELVQSWMDRLQLISVITTFFAAIEAQLIGITTPDSRDSDPPIDQAANAALAGALVVHVFAAIMSFFAAFFLIRYKLSQAKREERKLESGHVPVTVITRDGAGEHQTVSSTSVWSSNPHLEQVGPFRRGQPPTHLLDHLHSLCMALAAIGFVLALAGVVCFVWSRLSESAGVFASVCMGACVVAGVGAVFWPASAVHRSKVG